MQFFQNLIILGLVLSTVACNEQPSPVEEPVDYSILLSPIHEQQLHEGTSMQIHFAAIDDHLETLKFSTGKLPNFVKLVTRGNGRGYFQVDAATGTTGRYQIELIAENNHTYGKRIFQLVVLPKPENVLYLSPESNDVTAAGTQEQPLPSLEMMAQSGRKLKPNTYLYLMDGFHGRPTISFSECHIHAAANTHPVVSGIQFDNAHQVDVTGIEVSPEGNTEYTKDFLIVIDSLSYQIEINNCQIRTVENAAAWTQDEWDANAAGGLMVYGENCIINNNLFENLFHALQTDANHTMVTSNIIDRFGGDAIRNTGDENTYELNLIKNAVVDDYSDADGNHDDCFQSWTFGAPIRGITLKNNMAISCLEPDLPLKSRVVQGLVCFDGFEENWLVSDNLVILDHPHGIALFGAKECRILRNIVLRNPYEFFSFESDPWIMINSHKDGRPSMNNTLVDNLSGALRISDSLAVKSQNVVIEGKYDQYFKDYKGWDFRRK